MNTNNPHGRAKNKILVVEDESSISDLCCIVLTEEGYEVSIAVNGKKAQDMISKNDYDLLLIDIRTPEMNGKELYQWLKCERLDLTRGVIFTTGDVMGGGTEAFIEQSGRLFLPKPFTPDELTTTVEKALRSLGE